MSEALDSVYEERNKVFLAFLKSLDGRGLPVGYRVPDKESDDKMKEEDEESDWVIVWGLLPSGDEVSAHIPRELLPDFLDRGEGFYDGYSSEDNYQRLSDFYS